MVEDPQKVLEQMRPFLQWNVGADRLFKELQHCLAPEIQKIIKEQIKHEGNQVAVETILNQLICEDDWPTQLYRALLSPSINRPKLARKLKGSKMEEDITKELEQSLSSMGDGPNVQVGKKFEKCTGETRLKNLPMIFLSSLKQNLDIEDGWKSLAVQLGYSSDDIAYIDLKNGSPTENLILHWIQEQPDADIETIFSSLHKMECKSLSKELREICKYTFDSVDGASSNLDKDEPPISIPDFNQVPDLSSINESLKKGEHVSPTISPMLPHKAVITQMDMPKYSESYDQDCKTSTSVWSKSAPEKRVQSLDLFAFDTNKDTIVPLIESPSLLEPPLPTQSSEPLNDSSNSGISKNSQPLETSLECCTADITKPQMVDSGFMEYVDVKNQDLIEHSNDLPALGKNTLLLGSTSNENIVSESTSKFLQNTKEQITKEVSSKISKSSNTALDTNPGSVFIPTMEISLSESVTKDSKSKNNLSETAATPVHSYEHGDQIQISDSEPHSVHFYSKEYEEIGNEPEMELESTNAETVLESEVKIAKMLVENILESAFTQHFATEDNFISFEPKIISSEFEVNAENTDIEEAETDCRVGSQESALDNEVMVLSNPEEVQNDFRTVSQEPRPLSIPAPTFLECDATITQREVPVTLFEDESIIELPEEDAEVIETTEIVSKDIPPLEIEAEITESIRKQVILEDKNVSQSENNSEVLKPTLQNTKVKITEEVSSKMARNSITATDTNSGSMPTIPALESTGVSLSESDTEFDTKDLKTEVVDEIPDSVASVSLSKATTSSSMEETINSDTVVSDVNRMKETINSDLVPNILASEELSDILTSFPIPETEILTTEQVSVQDSSTESISEIQPDMAVLNITELASFMLISDTVTSKTVLEDTVSTCTMELEDSATELETSVILPKIAMINTVPEVKALTTLPEIKENTVHTLQETRTTPDINSEVKPKFSKVPFDATEIFDTSLEAKSAVKKDNDGVKEKKEIDMELLPQAVEVSLSSKDSDTIPLDDASLQQYIPKVDQNFSEEKAEKSSAKPRFTYHYYGYIVFGMAIVGSGMILLHKYWK